MAHTIEVEVLWHPVVWMMHSIFLMPKIEQEIKSSGNDLENTQSRKRIESLNFTTVDQSRDQKKNAEELNNKKN